ncbi:unnamed protein product, partial [Rotaria sp. Silwood2]
MKQEVQYYLEEIQRHKEETQRFQPDNDRLKQESRQSDKEIKRLSDEVQFLRQEVELIKRSSTASSEHTRIPLTASAKTSGDCVLITTGSFNPIHRSHLQNLLRVKQYLENECQPPWNVLAGYLSPTHDSYVHSKLGDSAWIRAEDRCQLCEGAIEHDKLSSWVTVSRGESMKSRKFDVVNLLLKRSINLDFATSGPDADNLNITDQTALFMATLKDRVDITKFLIEKEAHENVQNCYGISPLLLCAESACMRNHEEIIRYLLESGANVNVTSEVGSSPFLAICQHNNVELARLLIRHGAQYDVEGRNLYDGKINGLIIA